ACNLQKCCQAINEDHMPHAPLEEGDIFYKFLSFQRLPAGVYKNTQKPTAKAAINPNENIATSIISLF
ncbi:hypothetical protein, partial [uncultured Parabacteroides sp.]